MRLSRVSPFYLSTSLRDDSDRTEPVGISQTTQRSRANTRHQSRVHDCPRFSFAVPKRTETEPNSLLVIFTASDRGSHRECVEAGGSDGATEGFAICEARDGTL